MASHSLVLGEICDIEVKSYPEKDDTNVRLVKRAQWLRAAILGANDGLLSTTSLMLGVGASKGDQFSMVLSGLAGALAGAFSMAVGEFVSVSSQRDIEKAITSEDCLSKVSQHGLSESNLVMSDELNPPRGITTLGKSSCEGCEKVDATMAIDTNLKDLESAPSRSPSTGVIMEGKRMSQKAKMAKDCRKRALSNPYKAAAASALAFLGGSFVPLMLAILVSSSTTRILAIVVLSSVALALFGGVGAHLGGSSIGASAMRVLAGGWISMAMTFALLKTFDNNVVSN